jgi:hypothetical protein
VCLEEGRRQLYLVDWQHNYNCLLLSDADIWAFDHYGWLWLLLASKWWGLWLLWWVLKHVHERDFRRKLNGAFR